MILILFGGRNIFFLFFLIFFSKYKCLIHSNIFSNILGMLLFLKYITEYVTHYVSVYQALQKFCEFHRKATVLKSLLIELQAKRLKHRCFLVEFTNFLKTEIYERLLLEPVLSTGVSFLDKQHSRGILRKRCSENMRQIYRRTPMPKCNFNKVALQLYLNPTLAWVLSCKFAAYFQNTFS